MLTLELFVAWLIYLGRDATNLVDVMAEFDKATALIAWVDNQTQVTTYVISDAAKAEAFATRKISAIKIVRQELRDGGYPNDSLVFAKGIVDDFYETTDCQLAHAQAQLLRLTARLDEREPSYTRYEY